MTTRKRRERVITDDFRTFKAPGDFHIIRAASEGDHEPLINALRKRADEVSQLAADIIEGKLKRPSHRQKTLTKQIEYAMIAAHFERLVKANELRNRNYGARHHVSAALLDRETGP